MTVRSAMWTVALTLKQREYTREAVEAQMRLLEQSIQIALGRSRTRGQKSESVARKERKLAELRAVLVQLTQ